MVLVTATAQCFIGAFVTLAASFQSSRQQMERLFHKIEELQETVPAITFLVELLHAHLHDAHPAVFRKIVVEKLDAAEAAEAQRQTKKRGSCFRLLCGCCELLQRLCSRGAKSLEVYVLKDDNEEEPDEDGPHVVREHGVETVVVCMFSLPLLPRPDRAPFLSTPPLRGCSASSTSSSKWACRACTVAMAVLRGCVVVLSSTRVPLPACACSSPFV